MPQRFDFAILGASPFAALVALGLAETGLKVCVAGPSRSPMQLMRGLDVAAGAITRPETWQVLQASLRDGESLISRHFPQAVQREALALSARSAGGRDALGHIRHMAGAFGVTTEPLPKRNGEAAILMRGLGRLDRRKIYRDLPKVFAAAGVELIGAIPEQLEISGGETTFETETGPVRAHSAVLAGNATAPLVGMLGLDHRVECVETWALLTRPAAPVRWGCALDIDDGASLQRFDNGQVEVACPGKRADAFERLASLLAPDGEIDVIGMAEYRTVRVPDRAPLINPPQARSPGFAFGLEPYGAFLAPVFVAYLLGKTDAGTAAFFAGLGPGKREGVAEYGGNRVLAK